MSDDSPFDYEEDGYEDVDGDAEDFDADPATVAYLDQESAQFQEQREQFASMYGFDHDCHCAQDYAEGKLAQVTECYLTLTDDALENSAKLTWENDTLQGMLASLVKMNDSLVATLAESGIEVNADELLQESIQLTLNGEQDENEEPNDGDDLA